MKRHEFALGLWAMLYHARHDHFVQHQGVPPKRFEMHPAHWADLQMDERMRYLIRLPDTQEFLGIPIVVDVQADRLKMITSDNMVEYL